MRFMYLVKGEQSGPPPQRLMDELGKLAEQAKRNGAMIDSGGLAPLTKGTRVRLAGGNLTVMDGPFAESKKHRVNPCNAGAIHTGHSLRSVGWTGLSADRK
jgi:hypothetical protein